MTHCSLIESDLKLTQQLQMQSVEVIIKFKETFVALLGSRFIFWGIVCVCVCENWTLNIDEARRYLKYEFANQS